MVTYENIKPDSISWFEYHWMISFIKQERIGGGITDILRQQYNLHRTKAEYSESFLRDNWEVAVKTLRDTDIWDLFIKEIVKEEPMLKLKQFLQDERKKKRIFPEGKHTFRAFYLCPYQEMKVVILGQDPYHQPGVADGLAFSTSSSSTPPSLRNIFKETLDSGIPKCYSSDPHKSNSLASWATQGVLLLNTILTVEEGKPNSHKSIGWDYFVDKVFDILNNYYHPLVFLLWGKQAQEYEKKINKEKHHVLVATHPAAEAYKINAGFFGCRHFDITNHLINQYQKKTNNQRIEINWCT